MGYHLTEIERGEYGEFSKIRDAIEQVNKVMLLVELADLIGAIEGYCTKHNITLDDLITMKEVTKRAFSDGTRTPRTNEKGT